MTKTEILAEVRERTGRGTGISDIDDELNGVLKAITEKFDFLKHYKAVTLTVDKDSYDVEDDLAITELKEVLEIRNGDGDVINKAENREQFLDDKAGNSAGTPTLWWMRDKRESSGMTKELMFSPTPSTAEVVTIYHSFFHPTVVGAEVILLQDTLKECVIEGVCYEIYKGLDQADKGLAHKQTYEEQLRNVIGAQPGELSKVVYRDV